MHFWNLSNNFMLSWMYAYVTEKNLRVQHHLIRDITLTGKLNKIVKSNSKWIWIYPANCATSCAFFCLKIIIPNIYLSGCGYVAPLSRNYRTQQAIYVNRRDLLVVTAQILLNALRDGIVSVTDFSLMVFDECHHTNDNHSYNMIMNRYLDIKLQDRERAKTLPMVLY